jgi:hypothetical protein
MITFSLLFNIIPFILIPISMYLTKKRKSLIWEIRKATICYNCKEDLGLSEMKLLSRIMDPKDFSKLCVQCTRDIKIESIKNPTLNLKYKFKKYLISKKSDKLIWYFTAAAFFFIGLDITLMLFEIKLGLSWIYGSVNIIFWLVSIYKIFLTTKKPSE